MKYTTVGVDIAKNVFQLHWVDAGTGEIVNKQLKRAAFLEHFANRELYCSSATIGPVELEYLFGEINAENIDFHDEPPSRRPVESVSVPPKGGVGSISVKSGGFHGKRPTDQ